ncbi:MAG: DUF1588 domain-containing protein [Planctomycetota bacterium]|nr:DUF1588 domain-containing protein [Planctomycetota bacterium]
MTRLVHLAAVPGPVVCQPLRDSAEPPSHWSPRRMMTRLLPIVMATVWCSPPCGRAQDRPGPRQLDLPTALTQLLHRRCGQCHQSDEPAAGLDLTRLSQSLHQPDTRRKWERIHDRVVNGEMPPDGLPMPQVEREQLRDFLAPRLRAADAAAIHSEGRGTLRRVTREEFENNLRALLHLPELDIRDMLPPDRIRHQCNRVADALDLSRIQLAAYLDATEVALRQAIASGTSAPPLLTKRLAATAMFQEAGTFGGREAMFYAKDSQMLPLTAADLAQVRKTDDHDPAIELAIFRSASWPYYGYPHGFTAPSAGRYHLRFSARAVRQMRDFRLRPGQGTIPLTFRARQPSGPDVSGDVRGTGGVHDITPDVSTFETTLLLKQGETFEYSLLGLPVPRPINPVNAPLYYDFPPMPAQGHPGIAFQWLEVEGPLPPSQWPPPSHRVLFGGLRIRAATDAGLGIELVTPEPARDAVRLLRRFLARAQRRPLPESEISLYERLVVDELHAGTPLVDALLAGYAAFLCSPNYLYLQPPRPSEDRPLDQHYAIAHRLSHFLASGPPDAKLLSHAAAGQLLRADVLTTETDRLLAQRESSRFVKNFTDHWLALRHLRRDTVDSRLYPEYRFDDYLIESLGQETRGYFHTLLRDNLPVRALVQSNFVVVNDRLARHYELAPVTGSQMRLVRLSNNSVRGGLLTQGAVLKVTADGRTTSPVHRGVWVVDRLLGTPPPPPPPSVPAVSPDLRGSVSLRAQLASHLADARCAGCHARFDPLGVVLENFDVMGAWRSRYRSLAKGEQVTGIDRAGHNYRYYVNEMVKPESQLFDGTQLEDIRGLQRHLAKDERQLAANLVRRWTLYATGIHPRFSERSAVEALLDATRAERYRTRDLLHALIQTPMFLGTRECR